MTTQTNTELVEAAKDALVLIDDEINSLVYSYAIGGWDGKSKYALNAEGKEILRPWKRAAKKLRTALQSNPDNIQEGGK